MSLASSILILSNLPYFLITALITFLASDNALNTVGLVINMSVLSKAGNKSCFKFFSAGNSPLSMAFFTASSYLKPSSIYGRIISTASADKLIKSFIISSSTKSFIILAFNSFMPDNSLVRAFMPF